MRSTKQAMKDMLKKCFQDGSIRIESSIHCDLPFKPHNELRTQVIIDDEVVMDYVEPIDFDPLTNQQRWLDLPGE